MCKHLKATCSAGLHSSWNAQNTECAQPSLLSICIRKGEISIRVTLAFTAWVGAKSHCHFHYWRSDTTNTVFTRNCIKTPEAEICLSTSDFNKYIWMMWYLPLIFQTKFPLPWLVFYMVMDFHLSLSDKNRLCLSSPWLQFPFWCWLCNIPKWENHKASNYSLIPASKSLQRAQSYAKIIWPFSYSLSIWTQKVVPGKRRFVEMSMDFVEDSGFEFT